MTGPSLLAAMDINNSKFEKMNLGENLHPQYNWSQEIKEKILQFSFQITENGGQNLNLLNDIKSIYSELIYSCLKSPSLESSNYLLILYKIIAQTRDIVNGKGIYSLTYMMITEWAKLENFNEKYREMGFKLAALAFENCVTESNGHPLGSWKDFKYFLNYFKHETQLSVAQIKDHPVFLHISDILIKQLKKDINSSNPSLLAKWIPREKSNKFGWITPLLAFNYYKYYIDSVKYPEKLKSAENKALMHFRQTITELNKKLNTVQINQCAKDWKSINFNKNVTSITLRKQSFSFQNRDKKGRNRIHNSDEAERDRIECANNYREYINSCHQGKAVIKSKNISIVDLVRDASQFCVPWNYNNNLTMDLEGSERMALNLQWNEQCKMTCSLENMIAMVDTSGSMECDNGKPLYSAIGLGLRVAEKSKFGKRVLTFSQNPEWINLEDCKDFVDSVGKVRNAPWGMNTNFYAALDLILKSAIDNDISPEQLKNTTLVIFSDMQIDQNFSGTKNSYSLFKTIEEKYAAAGNNSKYKEPFTPPHLIFWNLRTTGGFPSLSSTKNTSMISGSNPNLLNLFMDKGTNILQELTPWKLLQESLNNSRYLEFQTAFTICLTESL